MQKAAQIGKVVKWSMVDLNGFQIQSADMSVKTSEKLIKGVDGVTVTAIEYDPVAEFTINGIMLESSVLEDVVATVKAWCATAAVADGGLSAGGSVIVTDRKISRKIEDAETVDISAKYLPYCPANT
ncbi:MAG: hypothetical protein J6L64_07150 [Opitutales bacterium]|nr:hypothetical protein [Opitutales bacterium]